MSGLKQLFNSCAEPMSGLKLPLYTSAEPMYGLGYIVCKDVGGGDS